jgi:hypothetical protein
MKVQSVSAILALGFFFDVTYSRSLPYDPTTILLPSSSSNLAFVFLGNPESDATNQLLSLNISHTLSSANLTLDTVTRDLPFQTDVSTAFVPSIFTSGEISVYAGSCSTNTSSQLWIFTPDTTNSIGNGTWTSPSTIAANDVTSSGMPGAEFLANAFSFSTLVHGNASDTQLYIFGGMCPTSSATTATWQSAASYSNTMLRLSSESSSSYTLEIPSSRGPPIAEAGFTITGLTPTYSNSSALTQQQNFVLLGGHTQSAFINMSQVGIWSVPEDVWSFVSIDSPPSNANTELAIKSVAASVDSRSGHTAVLVDDGSQIIVFGGWVGDTSQAAEPQLAILELGSGFGGNGDWSWNIPVQQPSSSAIYGHGAVMLPGGVMMVLGGYNISSSGNAKRDSTPGTNAMFLNVTSMSWISEYTNPGYVDAAESNATHASSSKKSNGKKIGLGVGLGLGLTAILIAALIFFWYNRRLRRRRVEREKHIQSLSAGHSYFSPPREMGQRSGMFPWVNNGWNRNNNDDDAIPDSTSAVAGYENLHAGVHGLGDNGIPPVPRHIQRMPQHSRNARSMYQPAAAFELNGSGNHGRSNSLGIAGPIHPIYEADEDGDASHGPRREVGVALGDPNSTPSSSSPNRHSDPFRDPPINFSAPRSQESTRGSPDCESSARSREREIQEWVSDWAAADALLTTQAKSHSSAGRVSPTRRAQLIAATSSVSSVSAEEDGGRTASNLSEQSVAISAMSVSRSGSSSQGTRTNSLRGFISNAINPFTSTLLSTTVGSSSLSPTFDRSARGDPPRSAGSSGGSFTTAHSSFPALQAEGENLLPRPDEGFSGDNSPNRYSPDPGSPSKSKALGLIKGRSGWLGSLRKAFVGDGGDPNHSEESSFGNRTPSPTRVGDSGAMEPRRTVSAGAMLWRRKQGRSDWDDSAEPNERNLIRSQRSNTFTGDLQSMVTDQDPGHQADDLNDEEWDIERAVQNRVVQVMFTVPKEKLRVVNHNVDEDMSDVGSLRSKKGSNKSLRHVEPLVAPAENLAETGVQIEENEKGKERELNKVQELVQKLEARAASPERV